MCSIVTKKCLILSFLKSADIGARQNIHRRGNGRPPAVDLLSVEHRNVKTIIFVVSGHSKDLMTSVLKNVNLVNTSTFRLG